MNGMKLSADAFRLKAGETIDLARRPTRIEPLYASKEDYAAMLAAHVEKLRALQQRLYTGQKNALLIVFQGQDAAGKDGAISHLLTGVNPQGCQVRSFKRPSELEFRHDFLWRAAVAAPERGMIGVFNRSYYEAALITRVHPELLREEGYSRPPEDLEAFFAERLLSIQHFERHLHACGTRIVKIFLHLSQEEQRKRLLERLDDKDKSWKATLADVEERKRFKDYWRAYEKAFAATGAAHARWNVVPADDKRDARLIVSQIVIEEFEALDLSVPPIDAARRSELEAIREALKG